MDPGSRARLQMDRRLSCASIWLSKVGWSKVPSQTREAGDGESCAEEINDKQGRFLDVGSESSLAACRHPLRGFRCLTWPCPRVRGLTRGYTPPSLAGFKPKKASASFRVLSGTQNPVPANLGDRLPGNTRSPRLVPKRRTLTA